jgi:hypothetical protein
MEVLPTRLPKINATEKAKSRTIKKVIFRLKIYLWVLFLAIQLIAYLDFLNVSYYPMELAAILATRSNMKNLFLAFLSIPCGFLLVARPFGWSLKGVGIGLFLITLFDMGNEWFLHMLAVALFAFSLMASIKERLGVVCFALVVLLYATRLFIKFNLLSLFEGPLFLSDIKQLLVTGCAASSYSCAWPSVTQRLLRMNGLIELASFILLSFAIYK